MLASIGSDSVVLRASETATPRAISLSSVRFIERGYLDGNYAGRGMVLGGLAGFATGAVLGYYTSGCGGSDDICLWPLVSGIYGVLGALAGIGVGFAIGNSTPHERWQRVPLPGRVGIAPALPDRIAVRFELRL
jgi:hypothetical protein